MKQVLSLAILVLISIITTAQTGTIKGKVLTTDGKPAAFVNVALTEIKKGTSSNEDGVYEIKNVKPGTYTLSVTYTGLETVSQKITVVEGKVQSFDFALKETASKLDDVIVQSKKSLNSKTVNIGRIAINPMDLPQGVTVVGQTLIKDQQAQRLSDIIKNVNGVYLASTRGSTQENFSSRGYSFSSTNMFKDGARINSGSMPEVSGLEKVEVLKGSAAILYGQVSAGGVVNLVTKQPKFEFGGEVSMRAGSYDLYKPSFDVYGPVSKTVAFRVNGTYESGRSYRNLPRPSERFYVNPSFLFKISKHTDLIVQGDYLKHDFVPDFGIGSYDSLKIPDVDRSTYFGTPWQYAKTQQASATASLKHEINSNWILNASLSYQNYNRDYYSTERLQAKLDGDLTRPLGKTLNNENYYVGQLFVSGKAKTGKINHAILAGLDADRTFAKATGFTNPTSYDKINIFDPNKYVARTDIPATRDSQFTTTPTNRYGIYVQDLISISEKVKLLAGIRYSYQVAQQTETYNYTKNTTSKGSADKVDKAFSPRVGIVYKPTSTTSVFASYSNSFTPNSGTDIYFKALAPSIIDQYEAGIKNDFFKGALSVNVIAYKIVNNNFAQTALLDSAGRINSNTSLRELAGQTTSDGIEVDLALHAIKGLDVLAGYSYNYIRYTKTIGTKGNVEGERLINNPASTANGSAFYTFQNGAIKGLKLGASAFFTGTRFAGFNNIKDQLKPGARPRNFEVEGFTTIDVSAGYHFKKVSVMAKISNITNTLNWYVHENYSINPIPPTQLAATITYKF